MSAAWAKGSSRRWRRIRARVLLDNQIENEGKCVLAIDGVCTGQAEQVHHTVGRAVSGDDRRYLVACCKACNLKVGDPTRRSPRPRRVSSWWSKSSQP